MDTRPAADARAPETLPPWVEHHAPPVTGHAGLLDGATVTGEAARRQLSVRIGLWLDDAGVLRQARWRAVRDPALRAYAEAACSLLEAGAEPARLDGSTLRSSVQCLAPAQPELADLVASAVHAAALLASASQP